MNVLKTEAPGADSNREFYIVSWDDDDDDDDDDGDDMISVISIVLYKINKNVPMISQYNRIPRTISI